MYVNEASFTAAPFDCSGETVVHYLSCPCDGVTA
jgi:hypothetical protein